MIEPLTERTGEYYLLLFFCYGNEEKRRHKSVDIHIKLIYDAYIKMIYMEESYEKTKNKKRQLLWQMKIKCSM